MLQQGPDLRDLRRKFREGGFFWIHGFIGPIWFIVRRLKNSSLLEDYKHPDFLRQNLWGWFGLQMASEAKSDLTSGFVMAKKHFLTLFGMVTLALVAFLWTLTEKENLQFLDLRLESRR